jgi:hypothetical protein
MHDFADFLVRLRLKVAAATRKLKKTTVADRPETV